jgi:hypothetical protein
VVEPRPTPSPLLTHPQLLSPPSHSNYFLFLIVSLFAFLTVHFLLLSRSAFLALQSLTQSGKNPGARRREENPAAEFEMASDAQIDK